jgi:hypothetical protein
MSTRWEDRRDAAVECLRRLKADFKMAGANATTMERAIQVLVSAPDARPAPTVEPVAERAPLACRLRGPISIEDAAAIDAAISALVAERDDLAMRAAVLDEALTNAVQMRGVVEAERDEAMEELAAVTAERDRAQKACEQIAKRFTPRRLRYAPKDRLIIGVERPPYEDETYFYDLLWSDDKQCFLTPTVGAFNGASHFLDPRDLIGLPPQERLSREDRKKATARAALTGGEDAN